MSLALSVLEKTGSNGEPAAWLLCKGAESLLKTLTSFSLFYFYKQMTELSPEGMTAVQRPIAEQSHSRGSADGFVVSPAI